MGNCVQPLCVVFCFFHVVVVVVVVWSPQFVIEALVLHYLFVARTLVSETWLAYTSFGEKNMQIGDYRNTLGIIYFVVWLGVVEK